MGVKMSIDSESHETGPCLHGIVWLNNTRWHSGTFLLSGECDSAEGKPGAWIWRQQSLHVRHDRKWLLQMNSSRFTDLELISRKTNSTSMENTELKARSGGRIRVCLMGLFTNIYARTVTLAMPVWLNTCLKVRAVISETNEICFVCVWI